MNNIEFSCEENYFNQKQDYPIPTKVNIPEWYKKLEHSRHNKTVKGCIPFLETLTSGYLLKIPVDHVLEFNMHQDNDGKPIVRFYTSLDGNNSFILNEANINRPTTHSPTQMEGSPHLKKNANKDFPKINNPWVIKTPPGYSCLFLPPLNNTTQDYFEIIPGIVHTDKYDNFINFPLVVNGEKYKSINMEIKKGLPYVQVIPFKREDWKMKIKPFKNFKKRTFWDYLDLSFIHNYKDRIWFKDKTKWK